MAKKEKEAPRTSPENIQNKVEKYYKAKESEKNGKSLALSIIGISVLCFIIVLIVCLKMSGVGKTIVFSTDEDGKVQASVADSADIEATNLVDYIANGIAGGNNGEEQQAD